MVLMSKKKSPDATNTLVWLGLGAVVVYLISQNTSLAAEAQNYASQVNTVDMGGSNFGIDPSVASWSS
jgi:hypothetical protein